MTTPAHTPGPWKFHATLLDIYPESDLSVTIARVEWRGKPRGDANARLLAAAPELLAALRTVLAIHEPCAADSADHGCWCQAARAALKKAEPA